MLKKTITFTDYNGIERTETHYFNLNKAELMTMQLKASGALDERIKKIVDAKDAPEIMSFFEELLEKSYGVKSEDGRRFIKSKELYDEFVQSEAYPELFMELISSDTAAADFIKGILPDLKDDSKPNLALNK